MLAQLKGHLGILAFVLEVERSVSQCVSSAFSTEALFDNPNIRENNSVCLNDNITHNKTKLLKHRVRGKNQSTVLRLFNVVTLS